MPVIWTVIGIDLGLFLRICRLHGGLSILPRLVAYEYCTASFFMTRTEAPSIGPNRGDRSPSTGRSAGQSSDAPQCNTDLTPLREMQLLELHRDGESDATEELLSGYQHRIYGVCYRMLHDAESARDLTQEAMIKILQGLDSFDGRSKLSTWIIRVAMNCCLSHLRREKIRRHASLDLSIGDGLTLGQSLSDESGQKREHFDFSSVERDEGRAILERSLQALDADSRAILVLRDVQELEYQQISEILDLPMGTVKSRLFRARAALREKLDTV